MRTPGEIQEPQVPVSGFARSFLSGKPIADATIRILEDEQQRFQTDANGKFGPIQWPAGKTITLTLEKPGSFWSGYKTTQTATITVPHAGINNPNYLDNISFQVPSNMAYQLLSYATGLTADPQKCQIVATVTPPGMTLDDIPQGIEGVKVSLRRDETADASIDNIPHPYYFGIFPITHQTNPFIKTLTATSLDGGVLFANVTPGKYTMYAEKDGLTFPPIQFEARAGVVVNASPPFGPTSEENVPNKAKVNHYGFFRPVLSADLLAIEATTSMVYNR